MAKKNVENNPMEEIEEIEEEATEKKPATKKGGKAVKKENIFKRAHNKVKGWMSDHPFISAGVSAGLGAAATVGACEVGKRAINRHNQKNAYIPQDDDNSLDPNI